jgi:hypothetical protein
MRPAILGGFIAAILLGAGALAGLPHARANGVPQLVKLTYLEGVSNFGPQTAEGVLEFSFAEAFARVDVKNLPPTDGYTYEGWLTGGSDAPFLVGEIEVDAAGIGVLETKLSGLASYDYDLFVVAARGEGTAEDAMPADRSIAGRFAVISDATGTAAGDVRPGSLPETGEKPPLGTNERLGRVFMIAGPTAGLALILLSLNRRRSRR